MNTTRKVGTLILIKVKPEDTINGLCQRKDTGVLMMYPVTEEDHKQAQYLKAFIVCDDEIKVGDKVLIPFAGKPRFLEFFVSSDNDLEIHKEGKHPNLKILVLPNQLSQEFLQAIVDGKVKDGDKIEVEIQDRLMMMSAILLERDNWELKLRKDGTAIIHPYDESVEEAFIRWKGNRMGWIEPFDVWENAVKWQKNQKQ